VTLEVIETVLHRVALRQISQMPLPVQRGHIPDLLEPLRQRQALLPDRKSRMIDGQCRLYSDFLGIESRHEGRAGRRAAGPTGVEIRKPCSLAGQPIKVRGAVAGTAVASKIGISQVIRYDYNEVRLSPRLSSDQGRAESEQKARLNAPTVRLEV